MPLSRSAISRPMLLITVATMALPFSRPLACSCRAHISSTASPLTIRPRRRRRSRDRRRRRTPRPCGSRCSRTARDRALGMRRAAVEVDVAAVGLLRSGRAASKPRSANSLGATVVVAPLAQSIASCAPAGRFGVRKREARVREVRVDEFGVVDSAPRPSRAPPSRVGDDRLDLALERLGELLAPAREHLDAVVLERIVRRRDHDARRRTPSPASGRRSPASG